MTVKARHWILLALFAWYIAALAVVAFWPTPVDRSLDGPINVVLEWVHGSGAPDWVDYDLLESGSNVALFIPIGLLVAALLPARYSWIALPFGLLASVGIETGQEYFRPERYATVQDVLANALGAAVGTICVYAWRGMRRKDRSARNHLPVG